MLRDAKLGYGFLFVGTAVTLIASFIIGPRLSIPGGIVLFIIGIGFLVSAHMHREGREVESKDWPRLIRLFVPLLELGSALAAVIFMVIGMWILKPKSSLVYPAPRGPLIRVERTTPCTFF